MVSGMPRSEWGIDSVIIGVNETNAGSFYDDFNMMMPDPYKWLQAESAVPRSSCHSGGNALEFSRDTGLLKHNITLNVIFILYQTGKPSFLYYDRFLLKYVKKS